MKQTVGEFMLRRVEEAGVPHVLGVPEDYSIDIDDEVDLVELLIENIPAGHDKYRFRQVLSLDGHRDAR